MTNIVCQLCCVWILHQLQILKDVLGRVVVELEDVTDQTKQRYLVHCLRCLLCLSLYVLIVTLVKLIHFLPGDKTLK